MGIGYQTKRDVTNCNLPRPERHDPPRGTCGMRLAAHTMTSEGKATRLWSSIDTREVALRKVMRFDSSALRVIDSVVGDVTIWLRVSIGAQHRCVCPGPPRRSPPWRALFFFGRSRGTARAACAHRRRATRPRGRRPCACAPFGPCGSCRLLRTSVPSGRGAAG